MFHVSLSFSPSPSFIFEGENMSVCIPFLSVLPLFPMQLTSLHYWFYTQTVRQSLESQILCPQCGRKRHVTLLLVHKKCQLLFYSWTIIYIAPYVQKIYLCLAKFYSYPCMSHQFSSFQFSRSTVSDSAMPWTAACHASLSITNSRSLLKLMSIQSVMLSKHFILHPFLLLPSIFPNIKVFSNESVLHIRLPKYWSLSFSINPFIEYSGPTSIRFDQFDLLAIQGTLKSLFQHRVLKASNLHHSAFFTVQLSQPYMTTRKTIVLTRWTFVSKVMSLLFIILSKMIIAFLPRSKCLLISWLQSPSALILEPPKNKVCHCFHCFPIYLP